MKAIGFFVAFLMSQAALAYPAVGDYVKYTGEIKLASGERLPLTAEIELTAFDAAKNAYTVKSMFSLGDQAETTEEAVDAIDLLSSSAIRGLVENCVSNGGQTSEAMVPAGRFDVCVIGQSDGQAKTTYSIGDVPFAIVKSESVATDGSTSTIILQDVRFGR